MALLNSSGRTGVQQGQSGPGSSYQPGQDASPRKHSLQQRIGQIQNRLQRSEMHVHQHGIVKPLKARYHLCIAGSQAATDAALRIFRSCFGKLVNTHNTRSCCMHTSMLKRLQTILYKQSWIYKQRIACQTLLQLLSSSDRSNSLRLHADPLEMDDGKELIEMVCTSYESPDDAAEDDQHDFSMTTDDMTC